MIKTIDKNLEAIKNNKIEYKERHQSMLEVVETVELLKLREISSRNTTISAKR